MWSTIGTQRNTPDSNVVEYRLSQSVLNVSMDWTAIATAMCKTGGSSPSAPGAGHLLMSRPCRKAWTLSQDRDYMIPAKRDLQTKI